MTEKQTSNDCDKFNFSSLLDGVIDVDSEFAKEIGFTSDGFRDYSYLYKDGEVLWISLVVTIKKGAFCEMMKNIEDLGLNFKIPTPSERMIEIGEGQGWMMREDENCFYLTKEATQ